MTKRRLPGRIVTLASRLRVRGAGVDSFFLALAVGASGVLTYAFQSLSARSLGLTEYGALATLWSFAFLVSHVLWRGVTQTLGRYVAEREARGEDWRPVVASVRRLGAILLSGFLVAALLSGPFLTARFFGGEVSLTLAFVVAVAGYSLSYFRRGLLSGHRQSFRFGGLLVAESFSRVFVAAGLLAAGFGVVGPAMGIALAPLFGVLLIRPAPVEPPRGEGQPFDLGGAFWFAAPVLVSTVCAQALANGGPILVSALGGPGAQDQAGLLLAALILTRIPQYVLSPVIANLLPHLSRLAVGGDLRRLDGFAARGVGVVGLVGAALVCGTWLFGEFAMRLLYGPEFTIGRGLLTVLALLAAFLLLCELSNQVLFARGMAWLAAASWMLGLLVSAGSMLVLQGELLGRISYALVFGALSTVLAQVALYVVLKRRGISSGAPRNFGDAG